MQLCLCLVLLNSARRVAAQFWPAAFLFCTRSCTHTRTLPPRVVRTFRSNCLPKLFALRSRNLQRGLSYAYFLFSTPHCRHIGVCICWNDARLCCVCFLLGFCFQCILKKMAVGVRIFFQPVNRIASSKWVIWWRLKQVEEKNKHCWVLFSSSSRKVWRPKKKKDHG